VPTGGQWRATNRPEGPVLPDLEERPVGDHPNFALSDHRNSRRP